MSRGKAQARATIDAWREQHADRLDPVRFHFIDALERRATRHGGETRRILDDRLSDLLKTYADDLEKSARSVAKRDSTAMSCAPTDGELGALIEHIAVRTAARAVEFSAGGAAPRPSRYPELEALDAFRDIWSRIRTERQMRQTLEQVPKNAGPLNSSALVHRSISLMRELSPGYLQHFLSYIDALSWMEQMNTGGALVGSDAVGAANTRKRARRKTR